MSSSDPLDLLRQSIITSTLPALHSSTSEPASTLAQATHLSFPSSPNPILIPKDAPTRYTSKPSSKEFYNIGQLWLAYTERESGVREYLMKGQAGGVGYVAITDRRGVVEYLTGENEGVGRVLGKGEDAGVKEESMASSLVESIPAALEAGTEAGPSKPASVPKRKYEVDVADREFCKKLRAEEIELRDRNTVLRSAGGGKVNNFQTFLQTVMSDKIRTLRKSMEPSNRAQPAPAVAIDPIRAKKARSQNPIIMISSSPTSLITMWNVKKFLEQGVFEVSDIARQNEASVGNTRAEDMIPILRKRTGPNGEISQKYYIVDGVDALQKFGADAWDRVTCVLTTGQEWQFRPYKWQKPKELFRHVKGVYFQWHNDPSNPAVKDWNVTEMRIDRNKRHTDRQVVAEFWRVLDGPGRR